jgi:hypothetical protein
MVSALRLASRYRPSDALDDQRHRNVVDHQFEFLGISSSWDSDRRSVTSSNNASEFRPVLRRARPRAA